MRSNQNHSLFPFEHEIPENHAFHQSIEQRDYLSHGEIRIWEGSCQDVVSPVCIQTDQGFCQRRIGSYPLLTENESLDALASACMAFDNGRGEWPTMGVEGRIRCVEDFALAMKMVRNQIVECIMWEIGKPLPDAEKEFDRTIDYIRDTIDALKELDRVSSRFVIAQNVIGQIRRAPLGVVLCMGPYNYPLNETFTTLIPALIMGNVVIFKPPKLGVLLHQPLLKAFQESFPEGVVNTVYGDGETVIRPLMLSGKIDVLAFIGSSRVADILKKQHPKPHRLRCVLGLEAKNAGIILPDADMDLAVSECITGSLSFNGQRCTALKILFVHRKSVDEFLERFCQSINQLHRGMPWESGVQITPLPEPGKIQYLQDLIDDAVIRGAGIRNVGGGDHLATFMHPAVVYPVVSGMRLYTEEQFGPVIPVGVFDHIEEPMRYIEESNYGQQVSIFGTNPEMIAELIDPLVNQVCRVNINCQCQRGPDVFPFTGRKDSAEGTLSVSDALRVFTIRTLVAAKQNDCNKQLIRSILTRRHSRFLSTDFIL